MKNVPTFHISVFLMIALSFSTPFVSYAQRVREEGEKTTASEQETNTEFEKLAATAKADAKRDVKVDFGNRDQLLWFSVGFGCSILGVAAAYLGEGHPPPLRLLGKPPDYVLTYGDTYRNELRKNRAVFAGTGCALSLGLLIALISNASSDNVSEVASNNSLEVASNNTSDVSLGDSVSGCLFLFDLLSWGCSCLMDADF